MFNKSTAKLQLDFKSGKKKTEKCRNMEEIKKQIKSENAMSSPSVGACKFPCVK